MAGKDSELALSAEEVGGGVQVPAIYFLFYNLNSLIHH